MDELILNGYWDFYAEVFYNQESNDIERVRGVKVRKQLQHYLGSIKNTFKCANY